jgi:hypothetical protein
MAVGDYVLPEQMSGVGLMIVVANRGREICAGV